MNARSALFALGLAGVALTRLAAAEGPAPVMRVHFLDVGQGAATLIELPCGAMLVDTGGEDDSQFHSDEALSTALTAFFARRTDLHDTLDLLLLTHPHIDHVRGAPLVLRSFTVKNLVDDGVEADQEDAVAAMREVQALAADRPTLGRLSVRVDELPADGSPLTSPVLDPFPSCKGADPVIEALWGGVSRDPGWGEDDYGKSRFSNANNHSVVTRIGFGRSRLLITGDLEVEGIGELLRTRSASSLEADIYQVGHHGSHNGSTRALLDAIHPSFAVMEVGPAERRASWTAWAYGHPRVDTLELLAATVSGTREPVVASAGTGVKAFTTMQVDCAIYATGWDGPVTLEADLDGHIRRVGP